MKERLSPEEQEAEKRRSRHMWDIAARVTDATPEKDEQKMKRRERDILDAIVESFKDGYRQGYDAEMAKARAQKEMVANNIIQALPDMSKEQLAFFKKDYEKKMKKIKEEKVSKGIALSEEEKKDVEVYKAVKVEIEKRMKKEQMDSNNQILEEPDIKKEKGKKGR